MLALTSLHSTNPSLHNYIIGATTREPEDLLFALSLADDQNTSLVGCLEIQDDVDQDPEAVKAAAACDAAIAKTNAKDAAKVTLQRLSAEVLVESTARNLCQASECCRLVYCCYLIRELDSGSRFRSSMST